MREVLFEKGPAVKRLRTRPLGSMAPSEQSPLKVKGSQMLQSPEKIKSEMRAAACACAWLLAVACLGRQGPAPSPGLRRMLQQQSEQLRVVGGEAVVPMGRFPWMVSLRDENMHYCGGALVAPRVVMTAAHCVSSHDAGRAFPGVRVGSYAMDSADPASFQARRAVQTAVHPGFDSPTVANDVALLLLDSPVAITPLKMAAGGWLCSLVSF